uniref:Gtp-binding protein obg n=1 Tax=Nannochloropsis gaditana (strain CCMP526) TaxID=1093141 RepID=I2CRT0_NANGC
MEKGEPGAERWLQVELKLVADVGFVGVPNAGKSTLLGAVSNARPKIADYPFTTIVPNLGVWDASETVQGEWIEKGMVLADIPGLLEGAHQGVGLGLAFLRHVQRCRVLVHVVNGDSPDPVGDYTAINQELALFNPKLAEKPQVVVLNKIDLISPEVRLRVEQELKEVIPHTRFMSISAMKKTNTGELMHRVWKMLRVVKEEEGDLLDGEVPVPLDEESYRMSYQIITDPKFPGQFRVQGKQIEKICAMTNWDYYEAVERFQRILEATGIAKALKKRGAQEGDLIMIGDRDFDYTRETNAFAAAAEEIRTWDSEKHYDKE